MITGKEATLEDIQKFAPDEVVIATGAEPQVPSFKTDGSVAAITADGPLPETKAGSLSSMKTDTSGPRR